MCFGEVIELWGVVVEEVDVVIRYEDIEVVVVEVIVCVGGLDDYSFVCYGVGCEG